MKTVCYVQPWMFEHPTDLKVALRPGGGRHLDAVKFLCADSCALPLAVYAAALGTVVDSGRHDSLCLRAWAAAAMLTVLILGLLFFPPSWPYQRASKAARLVFLENK